MGPLIGYFKLALNPGRGVLLFTLRTIVAGLLCLYLAFIFDLEQPKWALMTVIIISLPLAGMTLKRSFAQVIGTAAGAAVAVVLMALFPQAPMPFIVCLALWLAFCTAGGTLLRYTDSHAFVLSGFTAVVVAMLAVPEPDGILLLAITRLTETLLAVACVAVVSLLTARPQAVAQGYFAQVDSLVKLIARHAAEVIRTEEDEAAFNQRQAQLIAQVSALEGLRRHLYFDAPHLRNADGLVQLLANQLVLLVSRLLVLRQQRELIKQHWQGPLPADIQLLRNDELDSLDALANEGVALSAQRRQAIHHLNQRFEQAADRAEFLSEPLPPRLRSLAWALRWEQARLLQQLNELIELNEAIQQGRAASCPHAQGRVSALHLDFRLAGMNAARAFLALFLAGWLWIETAWDGARSGVILIGVMCSLMATLPRPLLASQNYNRGLLVALVLSAVYQFGLLPIFTDFEMLALCLTPLLYLAAVGLANPMTAGIGMGIGLVGLLMIGPQNVGAYHNSAIQWFEFAGGLPGRGAAGDGGVCPGLPVQPAKAHGPPVSPEPGRCVPTRDCPLQPGAPVRFREPHARPALGHDRPAAGHQRCAFAGAVRVQSGVPGIGYRPGQGTGPVRHQRDLAGRRKGAIAPRVARDGGLHRCASSGGPGRTAARARSAWRNPGRLASGAFRGGPGGAASVVHPAGRLGDRRPVAPALPPGTGADHAA